LSPAARAPEAVKQDKPEEFENAPTPSINERATEINERTVTSSSGVSCKVLNVQYAPGGMTSGPQTAVTVPQTCTGSTGCSNSVTLQFQVQTAVTTQSNTVSDTGTLSESIKAGVDFIVDAESTTTLSVAIGYAWQSQTSYQITKSNMTGITQLITQQVGTTAFLSFTPTYHCWKGDVQRGSVILTDTNYCVPATSGTNEIPSGHYTMVYIR
jgi:hypothetical protein